MATTGKFDGILVTLYVGGVAVGSATDHTFSATLNTAEATTKDSASNKEIIATMREYEFSMSGFVAYDDTYGYEELLALVTGRTLSTVKLSTEVVGDPRYSISAYATSVEKGAPLHDTANYSVTFSCTGALTTETVT